jgi:hypothetical protein
LRIAPLNAVLTDHLLNRLFIPLYIYSLGRRQSSTAPGGAAAVAAAGGAVAAAAAGKNALEVMRAAVAVGI